MTKKQLPVGLSQREIRWGICYLLFQFMVLGPLFGNILPHAFPQLAINWELICNLINLAALLWIYHQYLRQSVKYGIIHFKKLLLITALGLLVYVILIPISENLVKTIRPEIVNFNNEAVEKDLVANPLATVFGTVFLIPFIEEITYRGLIFSGLHQKNPTIAYLVSILGFSMLHVVGYWESQSMFDAFLTLIPYLPATLILTVAYEKSGSILAPVLIHTAVNAIIATKSLLLLTGRS